MIEEATTIVLISNTLIMGMTLIAYLYRIKIEKIQIKIMAENAEYRRQMEAFKVLLQKEKTEILTMKPEEIYDLLMKGFCDAKEEKKNGTTNQTPA